MGKVNYALAGPATSIQSLGLQWSGVCQDISFQGEDKILHFISLATKEEGNTAPGRLPQVLDVSYSTPCGTVPAYRLGKLNTVYSEWNPEPKRTLQLGWDVVNAGCYFSHMTLQNL